MASKKSVPHRCPKCSAEGSYYGRLVFDGDEPGKCLYHKNQDMEPVIREGKK